NIETNLTHIIGWEPDPDPSPIRHLGVGELRIGSISEPEKRGAAKKFPDRKAQFRLLRVVLLTPETIFQIPSHGARSAEPVFIDIIGFAKTHSGHQMDRRYDIRDIAL